MTTSWPPDILERMVRAVEQVTDRLHRAARALEAGNVPYAVVGGNAVAAHVVKVGKGSVRNTRDVDVMIRRADLEQAKSAMAAAGFAYGQSYGIDFFLGGPDSKPSEGVYLTFAGELVKKDDPIPGPEVAESERGAVFQILSLEALVRMKLFANRDKDRTHIRDLIGVGLIDAAWPDRFPEVLAERLRQILANPDG